MAEQQCLLLIIDLDLFVNSLDAFLDSFVRGILEIIWRLVIAFDYCLDRRVLQVGSLLKVQEVQADNLIEVLVKEGIIVEVNAIVEFCELEDDIDHLGFVCAGQTVMLLSVEYPLGTFVDHLRANRVDTIV